MNVDQEKGNLVRVKSDRARNSGYPSSSDRGSTVFNIFIFKSLTGLDLNRLHSFDLRIFRLQNITFN